MSRDDVVNRDDVPACPANERNAHMVEAMKDVDLHAAKGRRYQGQRPDHAALQTQEAFVESPAELFQDATGGLGTGEDDELQAAMRRGCCLEQGPRQVDGVPPRAARPECEHLAVDPDSHACSPARSFRLPDLRPASGAKALRTAPRMCHRVTPRRRRVNRCRADRTRQSLP